MSRRGFFRTQTAYPKLMVVRCYEKCQTPLADNLSLTRSRCARTRKAGIDSLDYSFDIYMSSPYIQEAEEWLAPKSCPVCPLKKPFPL